MASDSTSPWGAIVRQPTTELDRGKPVWLAEAPGNLVKVKQDPLLSRLKAGAPRLGLLH